MQKNTSELDLDFEAEMQTRAVNARYIMRLAGIPDTEQIPLWMLYKPQGTQILELSTNNEDL